MFYAHFVAAALFLFISFVLFQLVRSVKFLNQMFLLLILRSAELKSVKLDINKMKLLCSECTGFMFCRSFRYPQFNKSWQSWKRVELEVSFKCRWLKKKKWKTGIHKTYAGQQCGSRARFIIDLIPGPGQFLISLHRNLRSPDICSL